MHLTKDKMITFKKATLEHKDTIFSWLSEPHMQEFWDNSQEHRDDIVDFMQGRKISAPYFGGIFSYWVGFVDDDPYALIMTHEECAETNPPRYMLPHLSKTGKTYGLDFGIGNAKYVGKGLAATTLQAFMDFFIKTVEPKTDRFLIDPMENNPRAIHVYQKAGFEIVGEFTQEGGYFSQSKGFLMTVNRNKTHVYKIYDKISDWFDKHRSQELFEKPYLDMAIYLLKPNDKVLDLGCGTGEPIAKYFIEKGFLVTGIDASKKQIELAKMRVPKMKSIVADMRELNLSEKFNCIIAWHSFFHLPKEDQRKMFKVFEGHIMNDGILIFTSGPEEGEVWGNNGGEDLYHASLSQEEYIKLLEEHHFKLAMNTIEDPHCGGATVWVAQCHAK